MRQWFRRRARDHEASGLGVDFNCADQQSPSWQERAVVAVDLLRESLAGDPHTSAPLTIADFGAGNERLRDVLAERLGRTHTYHPYDLQPQQPTTASMNLAAELPDRRFDAIFCLGLV